MARRVLVGAVASLMLASANGGCTTAPTFSAQMATTSSITSATKVVIPSTSFVNTAQNGLFAGCNAASERVEITSVRLFEQTAIDITAKVVYLNAGSTTSYNVKDLNAATTSCYEATTTADLSFSLFADTNPEKTDAAVEIICPSATAGASCLVDYEITATCVTKSASCTPMPATSIDVPTLAANAKLVLPSSNFKAADGTTVLSSCPDPTKRLDITSVKIYETNGQNIKVDVGYQSDTSSQLVVDNLASGTCYQSASPAATKLGSKADLNADKVNPYVEVTCLGTAPCVLKYEVLGECVAKTTYPVLPNSITVPKTVGATAGTATIPLTSVVDTTGAAIGTCATGTRLDILSAAFVETSAATITADVKYQSVNTNIALIKAITVKNFNTATTSAFLSTISAAELSFASKANSHPDKVTPVLTLYCPSTATDCVVKYNVVGKCVPVSTKCTAITPTAVPVTTTSLNPIIRASSGGAALTCTAGTQRLDITSVKIVETTGANINVNIEYQQSTTIKSVVKSVTGVSCFDFGETDVSFASRAASNPGKVTPVITITCPSGTCNVQHDVIGVCVAVSPVCPTIADTAVIVIAGTIKTFTRADFVATANTASTKMTADCPSDQRLDITSVKIVETTGANVDVSVKYRVPGASNLLALPVKSVSEVACYTSTGTETSYGSQANLNPLQTDAIVDVKCLSATDCMVKYDIVAQCVAKSTACLATTVAAIASGDTIAVGATKTLAATDFKDAATPANQLTCTDPTKRMEIKSLKVVETNGASVAISVGYQKDATHQSVVKTISNTACYMSAQDELRFTSKADANPATVTPFVTIQCPSTTTPCVLKYEVLAECVAASTKCSTITTTVAQPITLGSIVEFGSTQFVDTTKAALVCSATQRAEIQSIKLLEVNGNTINAIVKYQKDALNLAVVKNVTGVSCYESAASTEVSFASKAATNMDYTNAIVAVECVSSNAGGCSIKYEITATCVTKSASCTPMPATSIDVPTLAANAKLVLPSSNFKAADGTTVLSSCPDPTKRLDITSVKIYETNGQNIKVDVGYQSDTSSQLVVDNLASGTCYQSASPAATKLGSKADLNADKVNPYVEVTCLGTAPCVLKYEVLGECVAKTTYPVLPNSITVPKTVGATAGTATIPLTSVVDTTGAAIGTCATGTRLDILSAAFVETSAATITADVKYQSVNTNIALIKAITVKNFNTATTSAFLSTISAAELSFASKANSHPDKVTPVLTLYCPSTATDCVVKYNVVGKCVPVSTKCTAITPTAVPVTTTSLNPIIRASSGGAALTCTAGTQRLDITSVKIVETTGANINVNIEYQQSTTIKSVVKSVTGVSCFDFGETDVSFASRAASNPGKVTPVITITCPSGTCNVQHDVIGVCVAPARDPVAVAGATTKTFTRADFVGKAGSTIKMAADCPSDQRLDITSVKIVETTGANVDVSVKYRVPGASNLLALPVKSVSEVACYTSTGTETSYGSQANLNPLQRDAIVDVTCQSATDCDVKYDIVGVCVTKSAACATPPTNGASVPAATTSTIALSEYLDAADSTTALSACTDASKRLEITSLRVFETNGANVIVNVGYQKDATHQSVVKTLTNTACYTSASNELRLSTAIANSNPSMTTPFVTIQCPSTTTPCVVKYEVLAECVAASTKCSTITTTVAQPITLGSIVEFGSTQFVDTTKAALVCSATQRAEIQSIKLLEVNGNTINAIVKYQKDATNVSVAKNITGGSCFDSANATELSFASMSTVNWDYTNTVVAIECAASNTADCSIKYEIVGTCVAKSSAPAPTTMTKATELANSQAAPTAMDSYTRAIAMVVSIAAGAAMMYMRH